MHICDHAKLPKLPTACDLTAHTYNYALDMYYEFCENNDERFGYFKVYVHPYDIGSALAALPISEYGKIGIDTTLQPSQWYIYNTTGYRPNLGIFSEGI